MARTAPVPNIPPIPGMCPSIAVLGGGAGGGGGSGNGAGDGSGNGPGNGDGNGEGAGGDGTGAGSCGNGANGACTNCSSGTAAGDPVDVVTGEVFTLPKTDLFLPGFFNLQIDRAYSSFNRRRDVGIGWGWTHSLAWEIVDKRGSLEVWNGLGQVVEFPKLAKPGDETGIDGWGLMRLQDGYVLRPGNEFLHFFSPDPEDPHRFRLDTIKFRNRGVIRLDYARGRLAQITDTAGRVIHLGSDGSGRITSLSVASPQGQSIVFARYAYDAGGHLIESVDADGHSYRFAYDDDRRLIRMVTPTAVTFHFLYDKEGRCVETWGERDGVDPALAADVPELLADGVTKAKGILHVKIERGEEGYAEAIDSVRVQRYFGGEGGTVTKGITGRGGVVSRRLDDRGRIAAQTDPEGATWRYLYDGLGNVVESINPEGATLQFVRDREGRVLRAVDPQGGVMEYGRNRVGDIEWMRDPRGGMYRFQYDRRGLLVAESRPDGGTRRFEHDAMGNLVQYLRPNGAASRYAYDFWGRRTQEIEPNGQTFAYRHSDSGRLVSVTDNLGRTRSLSYDPYGNVSTDRDAGGGQLTYHYGGLGWLYAAEHPTGEVRRAEYNREGWVTCWVNEKGQRHTLERNANGELAAETGFDGLVRRYKHDARGYVIEIKDAAGTTKIERNKLGQPMKVTSPNGKEKTFTYDLRGELVSASSDGVAFFFERDPLGAVVKESWKIGETSFEVESPRDVMGRRTALTTSLGLGVSLARDALGFVKELRTGGATAVAFSRDPLGIPQRRDLPRGGAIVDELDGASRLARRVVLTPHSQTRDVAGKPEWIGPPPKGTIDKRYRYFDSDELASVTTAEDGTVEYSYDLRKQLLERSGRSGSERFAYDGADNVAPAGTNAPPRSYDAGNRLLLAGTAEYVYDARGRATEKRSRRADGRDEVTHYVWDDWDMLQTIRLPSGERLDFVYDAFARRVEKRHSVESLGGPPRWLKTTRYVWDLVRIVHEIETSASGDTVVRSNLYEDARAIAPLAARTLVSGTESDWVFHVDDHADAPEELVDGAGATLASSSRTPYGEWTFAPSAKATTAFRFQGQLADPETGLHYNRYRYYDPALGRYLSKDPILLRGGFNAYAYAVNPIGWIDPMGWATHSLTAQWFPSSSSDSAHPSMPSSWVSTMGVQESGIECPDCLSSQARCHTERQAMHHLESNPETFGSLEGGRLAMSGELPPCPQCHRAMHDFAQRHGCDVSYEYPGGTITYSPGSQPSPDGPGATALLEGAEGRRGSYGELSPTAHAREGMGGSGATEGTAGATPRYRFEGDTPSRAYADERDAVRAEEYS